MDFRDGSRLWFWSGNPLVGDALSLAQFCALRHAVPGFGDGRPPYIVQGFLERANVVVKTALVLPSFGLVLDSLPGTQHITTVPRQLAELYAQRLPLKLLRCPVDLPPMVERMHWHRHREGDPLVRWLRDQLLASGPSGDARAPRRTPRPRRSRRHRSALDAEAS
jgi:LysR family transcriptional regulator, nod-box dependent transcriptional activator